MITNKKCKYIRRNLPVFKMPKVKNTTKENGQTFYKVGRNKPLLAVDLAKKYGVSSRLTTKLKQDAKGDVEDHQRLIAIAVLKDSLGVHQSKKIFLRGNKWITVDLLCKRLGCSKPSTSRRLAAWVQEKIPDDAILNPTHVRRSSEVVAAERKKQEDADVKAATKKAQTDKVKAKGKEKAKVSLQLIKK